MVLNCRLGNCQCFSLTYFVITWFIHLNHVIEVNWLWLNQVCLGVPWFTTTTPLPLTTPFGLAKGKTCFLFVVKFYNFEKFTFRLLFYTKFNCFCTWNTWNEPVNNKWSNLKLDNFSKLTVSLLMKFADCIEFIWPHYSVIRNKMKEGKE